MTKKFLEHPPNLKYNKNIGQLPTQVHNSTIIYLREAKHLTVKLRSFPQGKEPSKNKRMPLIAARTRYSLVKGERIVRFVLTARLRAFYLPVCSIFIGACSRVISFRSDMGCLIILSLHARKQ